jgi:SAM-dependent methyltransferase
MSDITTKMTSRFKEHHERIFADHGETARGVDWRDEETQDIRMTQMLKLMETKEAPCTLLDVGCGYGALLAKVRAEKLPYEYTGVDVVPAMIDAASQRFKDAKFLCADVFSLPTDMRYDYVICNGVITQKLDFDVAAMEEFSKRLIRQMFSLCRIGIAINVMSSHVNFMVPNLYYKNPAEMLDFCLSEITRNVRLNHHYGLYEYTTYLYK